MSDRELIKAELQNLQKILEAKADMCIGNGKVKLLSFANACSGALKLLNEQEAPKTTIRQYGGTIEVEGVTHWIPLPEPPKEVDA